MRLSTSGGTDFNPRSREGSDRDLVVVSLERNKISIHAPVKGATTGYHRLRQVAAISIHAPAKGATCGSTVNSGTDVISIHAPVKGATRGIGRRSESIIISIHAPVKGATSCPVSRSNVP